MLRRLKDFPGAAPRADRTTAEFYSDATIGEFWIGPRPALAGVAGELGLTTAPIEDFAAEDGDQTGARRVAGEEMLRVPHAVPAESGQPDAEDVFGHVCHPGAAP